MIEILSIDLSNYCSKQCSFCYNHSNKKGSTIWQAKEVIDFSLDCIKSGIKAVSLGGGEPFEYEGIFEIIDALYPKCYLSVTSNGLPLENTVIWEELLKHSPDKIHLTIHQPQDKEEVERIETLIKKLSITKIKPGVNLLVGANKIDYAKQVYAKLSTILTPEQIILVPQRFENTPTPKQISTISNGKPFQSPSCLLGCKQPNNFVSISWDKKVNFCSYAPGKEKLQTLNYQGMIKALKNIEWESCCKTFIKQ
ncbi:MAG: radical SAM protein [Bacteroidales bacterium]|nr:radical SAM protein [Bacteroidales bacterium]